MNILILSQYFTPQPLANAEVIGTLSSGLAAAGHEVHVVTPAPGAEPPAGVSVHRTRGFFSANRSSMVGRLLEYASFSLFGLIAGLRIRRIDVVLVPSPPPTLGIVGWLVGRANRAPLVYNVQDLYPDVADAVRIGRTNLLVSSLRAIIAFLYRSAAAIVVIDETFRHTVESRAPDTPVFAVRNAIDLAPFESTSRAPSVRAELGLADEFVVMYAGNVGRSQDLGTVMHATRAAGCALVVHGGGAGLDEARGLAMRIGARVVFSRYRPRSDLGAVYGAADLHVVPLRPGIGTSSLPSKLLSIWAAGRPAVLMCEPDTAAAALMLEVDGGWRVDIGDVDGLVATIEAARSMRSAASDRGARGRAWVEREATAATMAAGYLRALSAAVT